MNPAFLCSLMYVVDGHEKPEVIAYRRNFIRRYFQQEQMAQWLKLWKLRNEARHGKDAAAREEALFRHVHSEMQAMYELRMQVHPLDRHIFYPTLAEHLDNHPKAHHLANWLATYRRTILASSEHAKHTGLANQRRIEEWLQMGAPNETQL
jgi:hypothetical protein